MSDPGQKNFRLPPWLADDVGLFLDEMNARGVKLRISQLATAAFLSFFERTLAERFTYVQRARSPDIERLRRPPPVTQQEIDALLLELGLDARRADRETPAKAAGRAAGHDAENRAGPPAGRSKSRRRNQKAS